MCLAKTVAIKGLINCFSIMYTINFTCSKSEANRANLSKIKLWINVNGERSCVNLSLRVNADEFKKSLYSKRQNHITRYCSAIRQKVDVFYAECMARGLKVQSSTLADYVRNGFEEQLYMFYTLLDEYIKLAKQRVGTEICKATYNKYVLASEQLRVVIPNKPLRAVNNADILAYKYHLTNKMGFKTATLCSYLTKTKAMFAYALHNGRIDKNPFENITIKRGEAVIIPLTKEELMRIADRDFKIKRLNQVRDLFIFACNTALSYSDMATVKKEDIQITEEGVKYLKKQRIKTGITYIVPLSDVALGLLEQYNYVLPIISNQRYNSYLQEIADLCGIEKRLTSHIARHTAATLLLNSGVSIEVVAKILGHSNTKMTQHYAKLLDKTVINTKIEL